MNRLDMVRAAAVVTGIWAAEQVRPSRPAEPGTVPASPSALTTRWLTDALCRDRPGAEVTGFVIGSGSDGTSARRPLTIDYNAAGAAAGLPTALYTKSAPGLMTRLFCGLIGVMEMEGQFYLRIAPQLEIETPRGYHAVWDDRSGRALLIMENIATTRGATFTDPTVTRVGRDQADDMVDVMAGYHRPFWDDPRLDKEYTWLVDAAEFQRMINSMMGFDRMFKNGVERSRDFLPSSLVRRERELWPAVLRALDLEEGRPKTLVHQDPHSRNWYITGDDRMGIYDWQGCGKGSWATDVPYALGCGLTIEDRRDWERDLLVRYLERLGPVAPPFEQAWLSYRQQVMHGLAYWLATIGRTMIQPELQPHDVCVANVTRLAQAADDLDTLDAILA